MRRFDLLDHLLLHPTRKWLWLHKRIGVDVCSRRCPLSVEIDFRLGPDDRDPILRRGMLPEVPGDGRRFDEGIVAVARTAEIARLT